MIGNPGGGGPQTSSDDFTDAGADATPTCPSSPANERTPCSVAAADAGATRRSTTPAAGWMMTEASGGTAPATVGMVAMGAISRKTTTSPAGADQSRAASQKVDDRSSLSTRPPASRITLTA